MKKVFLFAATLAALAILPGLAHAQRGQFGYSSGPGIRAGGPMYHQGPMYGRGYGSGYNNGGRMMGGDRDFGRGRQERGYGGGGYGHRR